MPAIVLVMGKKEGCNKMSKKTHFVTTTFLLCSEVFAREVELFDGFIIPLFPLFNCIKCNKDMTFIYNLSL